MESNLNEVFDVDSSDVENALHRNTEMMQVVDFSVSNSETAYTREVRDSFASTYRKIVYENGNIYEGDIVDGLRHGRGKMTYLYGERFFFDKSFSSWIPSVVNVHPSGEQFDQREGIYDGEWLHDERDGNGDYCYSDGVKHCGLWKNGLQNGSSTIFELVGNNYVFRCTQVWKNGKPDGSLAKIVLFLIVGMFILVAYLYVVTCNLIAAILIIYSIVESSSSCDTMYDDVLLEPYVLIIVNSVLTMLLNSAFMNFVQPFVMRMWTGVDQGEPDEDKVQTELRRGVDLLQCRIIWSFGIIIWICFAMRTADASNWIQYTNIYGKAISSSLVNTLHSAVILRLKLSGGVAKNYLERQGLRVFPKKAQWSSEHFYYSRRFVNCLFIASLLPLLPAMVTHIIPGMVIYFWIILLVIALGFGFSFGLPCILLLAKFFMNKDQALEYFRELFMLIMITFVFQTLFNYMTLLYFNENYIDVVVNEFYLRDQIVCSIESSCSSLSRAIVFFNWIF